jgi:hypothetical protein
MPIDTLTSGSRNVLNRNRLNAEGLLAESFPRVVATSNLTLTGGTAYAVLVPVYLDQVITNALVQVQAAGNGSTLFKVGLYSLDGTTRYAATADLHTTVPDTTGTKACAFSSAYTVPTDGSVTAVYAVIVTTTGTTVTTLATGLALQTGYAAPSGGYPIIATGGTGLTDLPATTVTFTASTTVKPPWVGLT